MSTVLLAELISADGACLNSEGRAWAQHPDRVRPVQDGRIPVTIEHDRDEIVGRVVHLERRASDGAIWSVSLLADDFDIPRGAQFFASVETTRAIDGSDITIDGIGLTTRSASIGIWPATLLIDGVDQHGQAAWRLGEFQRSMLATADTLRYRHHYGEPIRVRDTTPLRHLGAGAYLGPDDEVLPRFSERTAPLDDEYEPGRPAGPLRIRPCRIVSVH